MCATRTRCEARSDVLSRRIWKWDWRSWNLQVVNDPGRGHEHNSPEVHA